MIILISGSTHTGKTLLAQKLMEKYSYPYLSIDHLKMGMIRSGYCSLTPESTESELTEYLWPIVREIIKTNIENRQNIIIEGIYIPFDYKSDFTSDYLKHIQFVCLIFNSNYIENHYNNIVKYADSIESRLDQNNYCSLKELLKTKNEYNLKACLKYGLNYYLLFSATGHPVLFLRKFNELLLLLRHS